MEIWDAYLRDGTKAGVDLVRGEPVPEGLYHLVSDVLVRHRDGDYLLMQRAFSKPNYAGCWEATAGGSALKGEDALQCAIRETKEETGMEGNMQEIAQPLYDKDTVYHSFLCVTNQQKDSVICQPGETETYRWLSEKEFVLFIHSGQMIDRQKTRMLPWLKKIGYVK